MQVFGAVLFLLGTVILLLFGFIGVAGMANIAGLVVGMAFQVSGSVFCAAGYVVNEMKPKTAKPGPD